MNWKWFHTLGVLAVTLAIITMITSPSILGLRIIGAGRTIGSLLIVFLGIVGHGIVGRLSGVLIDERNRMSLSRLQLVLWTLVILSAYLSAVIWNLSINDKTPLSIALPQEVWWLLGISTASLVGSPLILSVKKEKPPQPEEASRTKELLVRQKSVSSEMVASQGQVIYFKEAKMASLADLFKGDDTANSAQVDLSKVQMFLFTIVIVLAYSYALGAEFFSSLTGNVPIVKFPVLDESIVALLGISHAGYLSMKSVPRSTT